MTSSLSFVLRRSLQYGLALAVAITVNFALPRLAPGDSLDYLLGEQAVQLSPEKRQQILAQFGLDKPVMAQFGDYLSGLVRLDLGTSVRFGQPVTEVIKDRLPYTLAMVGGAIALSTVLGTAFGVVAAWKRGKRLDVGALASIIFLDSTPIFWLGMLLLGIFAVQLGWFPIFGAASPGQDSIFSLDTFQHLVLPVTTLTLGTLGGVFIIARYTMVGTLNEDYIRMAEASGLSQRRILFAHAMPNSLLPVVTIVMLNVGFLFSGAVVVETVFSYPGLGRLMFEGVLARDYPLLQGSFLLLAVGVVLANLFADLLYPVIDPRIRRPRPASAVT
jgi:peptide/nickel transport system permease protein